MVLLQLNDLPRSLACRGSAVCFQAAPPHMMHRIYGSFLEAQSALFKRLGWFQSSISVRVFITESNGLLIFP